MTQLSVGTVQPVKLVTVDTVSCLPRAHVTRFDTGEMILVSVLDSKTTASRVPGAVRNVKASSPRLTYDGSKSLISRPSECTSLNLDGHGALGVESFARTPGRHKLDDAGRVGNKLERDAW